MSRTKSTRKPRPPVEHGDSSSFARNQDFAILALLLCGGGDGLTHVEDVALKAFQLAPTRFKWERFDYPSLDTARVSLRPDRGPEELARRSGSKFYSLTSTGVLRAIEVGNHLLGTHYADPQTLIQAFEGGAPAVAATDTGVARKRPAQRALRRIKNHAVFRAWLMDSSASFELWQLAELLECMPDASRNTWTSRLENLKRQATFWQDAEVLTFAEAISAEIQRRISSERN